MNKTIKQSWTYSQPPEIVWEYLTNTELLALWLMENDFKPIIGHQFMFKTKPKFKLKFNGNINCEVLEVIPFQKLSYSWKGGNGNGNISLDSIVTLKLIPIEAGNRLELEHKGFSGIKNLLAYLFMNKGWKLILNGRLRSYINKISL